MIKDAKLCPEEDSNTNNSHFLFMSDTSEKENNFCKKKLLSEKNFHEKNIISLNKNFSLKMKVFSEEITLL